MTTKNKISSNISMNRLQPILYLKDLVKPSIQLKLRTIYKTLNNLPANTSEKRLIDYSFTETPKIFYGSVAYDYNIKAEEHNKQVEAKRKNKRAEAVKAKRTAIKKEEADKQFYKSNIVVIHKPDLSKLREALKSNIGNDIVVEYRATFVNGEPFNMNIDYTVQDKFSSWWRKIALHDWSINSGADYFSQLDNRGQVYIYKQNNNINSSKIKQYFRDGITHCMFNPIRLWAEDKISGASNKRAGERYKTILTKLSKYENVYDKGVPEEAISEICNSLQIDITIELPFGVNKFIDAKSEKKKLKQFRYLNTRLHHIELNEIVRTDEIQEVSRDEINKIKKSLDTNNEYHIYKKDLKGISYISTLNKTYALCNDYGKIVNEFELTTGLKFCKIDDINDKVLSDFIQDGMNYNGTVDFKNTNDFYTEKVIEERELEEGEEYLDLETLDPLFLNSLGDDEEIFKPKLIIDKSRVNHIDMTKAYANYKSCKLYKGFLGKITDFRQTDKIEGVGMYRITDLNFDKCDKRFKTYNDTLNIYINNNVYCSPELELLTSLNVEYKIVCGCWGVKPLDFDFNEDMMTKKDEGVPYYSKWAGCCDSHILEKNIWLKGDADYFQVIRDNCEEGIVKSFYNGEGCISIKKKHNLHLAHITAFITAYQRLNLIDQLLTMKHESIIRVCVDGIYYTGETVKCLNVFRPKNDANFNNIAGSSYVSVATLRDLETVDIPARKNVLKELHLGAGGSGKTEYNLTDKGLIRPMFIAPSWKLARSKQNEKGVFATVWARAISDDPERISIIKSLANVLIIDEVSMMTDNQKKELFRLYGDMKIIMCGDLGFQLSAVSGEEMKPSGFDNIVEHKTDYRCQDPILREIKTKLREMIKLNVPKQKINEWVVNEFRLKNRCIDINQLQNEYGIDDMILAGTNEVKDLYSKLFIGKFETEKYYVLENSKTLCNGDIVIGEKPEFCKSEIRHCFTTHSIQGETAKSKLFIDANKMFCSRMFYTAISRAKTLDQIYIIEREELKFKYEYSKIYKIESKSGVYIGSTINTIEQRFKEHIASYNSYKIGKGKFITSFKLLDNEDAKISLIEIFKCNDIKELWEREKEIIQQTECVNKTYNENK